MESTELCVYRVRELYKDLQGTRISSIIGRGLVKGLDGSVSKMKNGSVIENRKEVISL